MPVVFGEELFDIMAASQGGFDSCNTPLTSNYPEGAAQHGHVSVDRRKVLVPPASTSSSTFSPTSTALGAHSASGGGSSVGASGGGGGRRSGRTNGGEGSGGGGLGLEWVDVPTGGQKFGEDIRFVKSILSSLGRHNSTMAVGVTAV